MKNYRYIELFNELFNLALKNGGYYFSDKNSVELNSSEFDDGDIFIKAEKEKEFIINEGGSVDDIKLSINHFAIGDKSKHGIVDIFFNTDSNDIKVSTEGVLKDKDYNYIRNYFTDMIEKFGRKNLNNLKNLPNWSYLV